MNRRDFLAACAATGLFASKGHASAPFPVKFRHQPPYAQALAMVEPGLDEFPAEKTALQIEARLLSAFQDGKLPCVTRLPRRIAQAPRVPGSRPGRGRRGVRRPGRCRFRLERVAGVAG